VPPQCESIQTWVDIEVLKAYANSHPSTTALIWVTDGGCKGVLQVSGDLDQVRADLADEEGEPCLEQVRYSRSELYAASDSLVDLFEDEGVMILSSGLPKDNRVDVRVMVADKATARAVAGAVDDPEILFITGWAIIIE
jgi:hypothetical protein